MNERGFTEMGCVQSESPAAPDDEEGRPKNNRVDSEQANKGMHSSASTYFNQRIAIPETGSVS